MPSRKRERRQARESALALLYSSDITELEATKIVEDGAYPAEDIALADYSEMLVNGVVEHREEIDARLASTSENWALDRMPVVDRAILRLAMFEILFVDEVPVSVAINEAVELAKIYGGEDESSRFVNGVLGRVARMLEGGQAGSEAGDEAPAEAGQPEPAEADAADDAAQAPDAADDAACEPEGAEEGEAR